jgi:hypothetical protein
MDKFKPDELVAMEIGGNAKCREALGNAPNYDSPSAQNYKEGLKIAAFRMAGVPPAPDVPSQPVADVPREVVTATTSPKKPNVIVVAKNAAPKPVWATK